MGGIKFEAHSQTHVINSSVSFCNANSDDDSNRGHAEIAGFVSHLAAKSVIHGRHGVRIQLSAFTLFMSLYYYDSIAFVTLSKFGICFFFSFILTSKLKPIFLYLSFSVFLMFSYFFSRFSIPV